MSSLWTPGGEVPVGRSDDDSARPHEADRDAGAPQTGAGAPSDEERAMAEQLAQMREQLLQAPAAQVVAQHLMALFELAALHLGEDEPRLPDAKMAIDAVEAVVDRLGERLGEAEAAIRGALPQLKMAFVEASDRARPESAGG